jgi:FkbM family methyltransferase
MPPEPNPISLAVCQEFMAADQEHRFLLGATPYAAGIASKFAVKAVIDDFTTATTFSGLPVLRTSDVRKDALVVATTIGRPLTAAKHLDAAGLRNCDYFTFHRHCGVELPFARFWTGFGADAEAHGAELALVRERLKDSTSLALFDSLVNFRLSANPAFIADFRENQAQQYFEDFLQLNPDGESFADIGSFDGRTSTDFIARCPGFKSLHIFEPDPQNLQVIQSRFKGDARVTCHALGLGEVARTVRFSSSGSTSSISADGEHEIQVQRLDSIELADVTFLKMDIEGAELDALRGARETIRRHHPRMAICVYHEPGDLWQIPQEILAVRDDYDLYLRQYTEGVTETVMFFMPK